jgi:hypothetical protein
VAGVERLAYGAVGENHAGQTIVGRAHSGVVPTENVGGVGRGGRWGSPGRDRSRSSAGPTPLSLSGEGPLPSAGHCEQRDGGSPYTEREEKGEKEKVSGERAGTRPIGPRGAGCPSTLHRLTASEASAQAA